LREVSIAAGNWEYPNTNGGNPITAITGNTGFSTNTQTAFRQGRTEMVT
jgi:hypothetical protein